MSQTRKGLSEVGTLSCDWKDEKGLVVGETEKRGNSKCKGPGLLTSGPALEQTGLAGPVHLVVGSQAMHSCWLRADESAGAPLGWTGAGLDLATGRPWTA